VPALGEVQTFCAAIVAVVCTVVVGELVLSLLLQPAAKEESPTMTGIANKPSRRRFLISLPFHCPEHPNQCRGRVLNVAGAHR
jgi:hypothetical protein